MATRADSQCAEIDGSVGAAASAGSVAATSGAALAAGDLLGEQASCPPGLAKEVDLDALAVRLDGHARSLRSDLLDYFLRLKEAQLQQRRAAVEAQAAEGGVALAAKHAELEGAHQQLVAQRQRAKRLAAILERTVYRLHRRKQQSKRSTLFAKAFKAWLGHTRRMRHIEANYRTAAKHYNVGRLMGGVFRAWRAAAHTVFRERLTREQESSIQSARQQIWQDANASNLELSQRLAEVEGELAAEKKARAKLEEDMKRAFMRGVCALNIEAMALMKSGGAPGGANPFADVSNQLPHLQLAPQSEEVVADGTREQGQAAPVAVSAEPWLIGSAVVQHAPPAAAGPPPAGTTSLPWQALHIAKPVPSSTHTAQAFLSPAPAASGTPAAAAGGLALLPKPAAQAPHPIIKVAPSGAPIEVLTTGWEGQLAERSPAPCAYTRPAVSVPSSLPNNVPERIAAAMQAQRPQTAAAGTARPRLAGTRQRPATSLSAGKPGGGGSGGGGGLSQRSLAAKKGVQVVRHPQQEGAAAQQRMSAQEVAALRQSMHGNPGGAH